jgi:hypothetical protein
LVRRVVADLNNAGQRPSKPSFKRWFSPLPLARSVRQQLSSASRNPTYFERLDLVDATAVVLLVGAIYFIPLLVAVMRKVPNAGSVFVINLFLGWTLVGWVVSLAMAARSTAGGDHEV